MMLTATVPDKLSVTSFVYQMNQYFTKATISAISRDSDLSSSKPQSPSGNKASPFDLSAFDRFTFDKLSPVIPPQHAANKILGQSVYSRHSRNNSLGDNNGVPLSPIQNEDSSSKTGDGTNLQSTPKVLVQDESATEQSFPQQTPTHKQVLEVRAGVNQRPQSAPVSPQRLTSPPLENGNVEDTKAHGSPSKTDDRALEFENLGESEESEDATTVSSCSLDTSSSVGLLPQAEEKSSNIMEGRSNDRENGRVSLPAEGGEWGTTAATTSDENRPSDVTSPEHVSIHVHVQVIDRGSSSSDMPHFGLFH